MSEKINTILAGDDRISEIVLANPHTAARGRAGMIIRSEIAGDDGEYTARDQLAVAADLTDPACKAFVEAAAGVIPGLTLETYMAATKAGAYAARKVVRAKVSAEKRASIEKAKRELEAQLTKLDAENPKA